MQAYGSSFARIYNLRWGGFARQIAPRIQEVYESSFFGRDHKTLLDLCCGAGHLALHFLEQGYQVIGIDLSPPMLQYARENTDPFFQSGQVEYILADARSFTLECQVGLAVSTFDALNHLEDFPSLRECFASVFEALLEGGMFIFDLNTRQGLKNNWNNLSIEDTEEITIINRGIYDGESDRAVTRITGYSRTPQGLYERFEETAYNTAFDLGLVKTALLETGFRGVSCASGQDLNTLVHDPESLNRAFFITQK